MSDSTRHTDTELPDPLSGARYDEPAPDGTDAGLIVETSEGDQELGPATRPHPTSSAARSARCSAFPRVSPSTRPTSMSNGPTTSR